MAHPQGLSQMRVRPHTRFLLLPFLLFSSLLFAAPAGAPDQQPLIEALRWVRSTHRTLVQYDYIMTVRLQLLFFWTGKDDVGSGYIRRGISAENPNQEFFQVLFGSDPDKAPRAINRWGAGTEVALHKDPVPAQPRENDIASSAFFGFMKSSRGKSVSEMQDELKKEKERGEHYFTGNSQPRRAVPRPLHDRTHAIGHRLQLASIRSC